MNPAPTTNVKFQKIHSDLIIETDNRKFVTAEEKVKISGSLQSDNNLSDLTDTAEAVTNLGLDTIIAELTNFNVVNERLLIQNGGVVFTKAPLSSKIILDICYIVDADNLILAEEYQGLDVVGTIGTFNAFDPIYEGNYCLVSYMSNE